MPFVSTHLHAENHVCVPERSRGLASQGAATIHPCMTGLWSWFSGVVMSYSGLAGKLFTITLPQRNGLYSNHSKTASTVTRNQTSHEAYLDISTFSKRPEVKQYVNTTQCITAARDCASCMCSDVGDIHLIAENVVLMNCIAFHVHSEYVCGHSLIYSLPTTDVAQKGLFTLHSDSSYLCTSAAALITTL